MTPSPRAPRRRRRSGAGLLVGGVVLSVSLSAFLSVPGTATASPLGDAKARATALREQVDALRQQAEIATEQYDATYAQLGQAVNAHIEAQRALDDAQVASGATGDRRDQRARALYMSGGPTTLYATVLSAGSIGEVASRMHSVQIVLDGDTRAVQQAQATVASLSQASQRLAETEQLANRLQKQVADQSGRITALLAQTDALLKAADKRVLEIADQQRRAAEAASAARAAAALAAARGDLGTLPDVPASPLAKAALAFAQQQLGKPYVWGATGPDSYDCSGLTGAAYAAAGLTLPRTSREQWYAGPHVALAQLEPGDLLFWATDTSDPATIHHVALYAGNGLMVAAPHTGDVVRVQQVYLDGYIGAVRPGVASAGAGGTSDPAPATTDTFVGG